MKITLITVGKTKQSWLQDGINEYLPRLSGYYDLKFIELKEEKLSPTFTREKCIDAEGQAILKSIPTDTFLIILDEKGKEFTSIEFASFLRKHQDQGKNLTIAVGGAYGLSAMVKSRADLLLSLSKLTFTHQMIRPILLEQLYRAATINQGKEYHY